MNPFWKNPRGQSSAPFEVLVAVVIMSFVLFMGLQAVTFFSENRCKSDLQQEAANLKAKVQEAIGGNSVLLNFHPPECFKNVETEMRLKVQSSTAVCSSICGKTVNECLLFTYRSEKYNFDLCFDNAPTYTTFLDDSLCGDETVDFTNPGEEEIKPGVYRNSIPAGNYYLQSKTGSTETVPKICALKR